MRTRGDPLDHKGYFKKLSTDQFERVHLGFLKWVLGVHNRATNTAVYGETGRAPLSISVHQQCSKYFTRALSKASDDQDSSLLALAVREQRTLNLEWFDFWDSTLRMGGRDQLEHQHVHHWNALRSNQSKLSFFNTIKHEYGYSQYLDLRRQDRSHVAKLRLSAHDLLIETGRYTGDLRTCRYCVDRSNAMILNQLPMADPILEDETHALFDCPEYEELRENTPEPLQIALKSKLTSHIFNLEMITPLNKFLAACRTHRSESPGPG